MGAAARITPPPSPRPSLPLPPRPPPSLRPPFPIDRYQKLIPAAAAAALCSAPPAREPGAEHGAALAAMEPRWSPGPRPAAPEVTAGPGGGRRSALAGGREEEEGGKLRGMKLRGARPRQVSGGPRPPRGAAGARGLRSVPGAARSGGGSVPASPGALGAGRTARLR